MATSSPPTGPVIFLLLLLLLLILAAGHFHPSSPSELPSSLTGGSRSLLATSRRRADTSLRQQEAECSNMGSEPECRGNPSCRWCLSDDVNDMCFLKSESLHLPPQIFSCES